MMVGQFRHASKKRVVLPEGHAHGDFGICWPDGLTRLGVGRTIFGLGVMLELAHHVEAFFPSITGLSVDMELSGEWREGACPYQA
jgi:hypothetical protein